MTEKNRTEFIKFREIKRELTPTEVKIVNFIENNTEETIRMSITDLAYKCEGSESGIVRFCKKLGFKGYQELKIALAQKAATVDEIKQLQQDVELGDSVKDICKKVCRATVQSLHDTESITKYADVERAVKLVTEAKSLSFYGMGGSGVVATDSFYRFSKLGKPCYIYTDAHSQLNRSLMTKTRDVIIAVSHSGRSRDLLLALTTAKKNGASLIAVTQFGNSPITKVADVVLYTSSNETVFRHDAMASRIAETVLLDSLFTSAAITCYKEVVKYNEESWKLIESLRINNIKELETIE